MSPSTAKTVLITGTSSGIGLAAAKHFAAQGWNVVATQRTPEKDTELRHIANVLATRLDVQDLDSMAPAIEAGIARFGRIDALVNNSGYGQYGLLEAVSREQILAQFEVNVFGVIELTRAILPHFRKNKGGMVINVSSGAGMFTLPMISMYCASKFALEGFSEAVSYELASQNIAVKLVTPHGGVTSTSFNARTSSGSASDSALSDYGDFVADTAQAFAAMTSASTITSDDVAKVIYGAATDGSSQLRYLVGDDARGFVKARREMSEGDYMAFMRAKFLPAA
ncbi:MAG: SDR family oxidoreductase [Polaromonas sp.]|nr:SDR family oxidoreductase [Polaromonas sp.]